MNNMSSIVTCTYEETQAHSSQTPNGDKVFSKNLGKIELDKGELRCYYHRHSEDVIEGLYAWLVSSTDTGEDSRSS